MRDSATLSPAISKVHSMYEEARKALLNSVHDKFFYALSTLVIVYVLTIKVLTDTYGAYFSASVFAYSQPLRVSFIAFLLSFFIWRMFIIVFVSNPDRLLPALAQELRQYVFNYRRVFFALPVLALLMVFFSSFTAAKNLIPTIEPFYLDPVLAKWESWLHFGKQPWEWLQPVFGFALATSALSLTYKTWFIMKLAVCFWQAFSLRRPQLRAQFFISFVLCWIVIGTILATLMSSVGPVYFGNVYPDLPNPYIELVTYLRHADQTYPVYDLWAIDFLWDQYVSRESSLFSGISAMPSMHVSLACLFALLGWRLGKGLGIFFSIYLLLILIGSVHLSWHYALDGYVAIILTTLIWSLVGKAFPEQTMNKTREI